MMEKVLQLSLGNICYVLSLILLHLDIIIGISMRNASVPHYGVKDGTAVLICDFELGNDRLLDLKWYKDEKEFFRYSPNSPHNILVYTVEGVNVDVSKSSLKQVTLRNISLNTTGLYKCEILADKSFQTISEQGHMIVIAPPLEDPEIYTNHSTVSIGERLQGNCSSYRSKPAASLMFYINGQKPDFGDMIEYLPINEVGGLETSVLGFNFLIEPSHFSYPNYKLELKCTATLGNHYKVTVKKISEGKINAQPSSERNKFNTGCSLEKARNLHIITVTFLFYLNILAFLAST